MNKNKYKVKPPWIALNQNKLEIKNELIRRFVRVDYPVYRFPVEITERASEPYQEIERNIEFIIDYTEIDNREALFKTMGINELDFLGNSIIEYLISIGHIEERERLFITDLAKESLKSNKKIKEERSARVIYFDALSLEPLPYHFYKAEGSKFLSPRNDTDFRFSNVIDVWDDFPYDKIKKLLDFNGKERLEKNLPQEMIDIELSEEVKKAFDEIAQGYVWYLPLYVVILDNIKDFKIKMKSLAIEKLKFKVINGVNGRESSFFERLIKDNIQETRCIFKPLLENFNPLSLDESNKYINIWGKHITELSLLYDLQLTEDQNLLFYLNMDIVDKWINNDEMKPLLDIAYNNVVTINDNKYNHGRIMTFKSSQEIDEKVIEYLLNKKEERLREEDKSDDYIVREKERNRGWIINIRTNNSSDNKAKRNRIEDKKFQNESAKIDNDILLEENSIIDKLKEVKDYMDNGSVEKRRSKLELFNKPGKKVERNKFEEHKKDKFNILSLAKILFLIILVLMMLNYFDLFDLTLDSSKIESCQNDFIISAVVKANSLRVREGPGTDYDVLSTYDQGEEIQIYDKEIKENSIWYKVYLDNQKYNGHAWICGELGDNQYIRVIE